MRSIEKSFPDPEGLAGDSEQRCDRTDHDGTIRALPGLDGPLVLVGRDAADGLYVVLV